MSGHSLSPGLARPSAAPRSTCWSASSPSPRRRARVAGKSSPALATMYYSQEIHEGHSRILSRMRLSHNSPESWTQEVIKGRVYETRWGTFDETGSYISLEGRTFSSYDATTGDYETETVPEGTRMAPRGGLWPVQVSVFHRLFGKRPEAVTTQSRVCFRGDCTDNAPGWKYAVGRQTFIIADDARGIPIQRNNFVIDEILVHADQEPLNP